MCEVSNINVIWNHIFFSPLLFLRLRKWNLKHACTLFPHTYFVYSLVRNSWKNSHISFLSLPLFPQCTCCTLMQLNCALFLLFLFTYLFFFSHRMWFISGHKNKGSCWCCFIVFSCNQLASETHSFWLWPHSHWNQ